MLEYFTEPLWAVGIGYVLELALQALPAVSGSPAAAPALGVHILIGMAGGALRWRWLKGPSLWAWGLPLLAFLAGTSELMSRGNFFTAALSRNCGASDCLYELLFTVPLLLAVGYSLMGGGKLILKKTRAGRRADL